MVGSEVLVRQEKISVSHVADSLKRYPGETVILFTRIEVTTPLSGLTLRVGLPEGLTLDSYEAPRVFGGPPSVKSHEGGSEITWSLDGMIPAGASFEFEHHACIAPTPVDVILESGAEVIARDGEGQESVAGESITLRVRARGAYLRYLPALYESDELMGRFLMLFESFWGPVDQQISNIYHYFDPAMTPPELLPWLASWLHLVLDERWPEEKRRKLLQAAAELYRKRGTKQGLKRYLEIYTGEKVQIIEHRAENFRLGADARLGPGIALGKNNVPHTFTVILSLPSVPCTGNEDECARLEAERLHLIQSIIEAEKPAHTMYALRIDNEGNQL